LPKALSINSNNASSSPLSARKRTGDTCCCKSKLTQRKKNVAKFHGQDIVDPRTSESFAPADVSSD
jgi:hypothetical protein